MSEIKIGKTLVNHDPNEWYFVKIINNLNWLAKGTIITKENGNISYCIKTNDIYFDGRLIEIDDILEIREATEQEIKVVERELNNRNKIRIIDGKLVNHDPDMWYYIKSSNKYEWITKGTIITEEKGNITYDLNDNRILFDGQLININSILEIREATEEEIELVSIALENNKKSSKNIYSKGENELKDEVIKTINRLYEYNKATIEIEQPLEVMGAKMKLNYWQYDSIIKFMSYAISKRNHEEVSEVIHNYIANYYNVETIKGFVDSLFLKYYIYW